jgi:ABC-type nickel/cobalt efflux system permease component RcnA
VDGIEIIKAAAQYGPVVAFGLWLLYRYSQGKFISEREHLETLDRIKSLEAQIAKKDEHHASQLKERDELLNDTRSTLHEAMIQNSTLIQAASVSTQVMRALDERSLRAREGDKE